MNSTYVGSIASYLLLSSIKLADKLNLLQVITDKSAVRLLQAGRVVVFANHPSYLETVALRYVLDTLTHHQVWSVADEQLFPSSWYGPFQCIPVYRAAGRDRRARLVNVQAMRTTAEILSRYGVVVVYPEGTRTCNAAEKTISTSGAKQVGVCKVTFLTIAAEQGAKLIPVWIEHGDCSTPQGFIKGYVKLLQGVSIKLRFGPALSTEVTPRSIAATLLETAV